MRSPTLSHESDSEEVGYLGVLELKIVFKKFKLSSRSRKSELEKIKSLTWWWMKEGIPCIWSNQNSYINCIETHLIYICHIILFSNQTAELDLITVVLNRVLKFNQLLSSSEKFINNPLSNFTPVAL